MSPERVTESPDWWQRRSRSNRRETVDGPPARVINMSDWRSGDLDRIAEDLLPILSGLMQPPSEEGWEVEGNVWMHDRLMAGKVKRWDASYDRDKPGVVHDHPLANQVERTIAEKLLDIGSSFSKFVTAQAIKRSEAMSGS